VSKKNNMMLCSSLIHSSLVCLLACLQRRGKREGKSPCSSSSSFDVTGMDGDGKNGICLFVCCFGVDGLFV